MKSRLDVNDVIKVLHKKTLTLEFTLEMDHLDVMFVKEDFQIDQLGIGTCVLIKNKNDS